MQHKQTTRGKRLAVGLTTMASVAAIAGLTGAPNAAAAPPTVTITPWLGSLNAPRGVAFDGAGHFYVAESGVAGSGTQGLTHTGRVSRYSLGSTTPVWQTSTSSIFATEDPTQPPDVLGPEGVSAMGPGCNKNNNGCQVLVIMSESHDGTGTGGQTGDLLGFDQSTGAFHKVANVGDRDFHFTKNHVSLFPSDFPDANPYAVLVTHGEAGSRTFVADAGANTIDEVMANGQIRIVSYIPNETSGQLRDATPTCIAQGPDGMLYVGTLDLLSNFAGGGGSSNVWRVNPDASFPTAPQLWATGLTTVSACTTDRHGNRG